MTGRARGRRAALATLLILSLARTAAAQAPAAGGLPAPVRGIAFEEWAAANARLAAGRPLPEVLAVLGASEADWAAADAAFLAALRAADPAGPVIARYGEAFARPDAGRFAGAGEAPKPAEIGSAEAYLRVQAELTAAGEVGLDPNAVLRDRFGLTPFDYARAGERWTRHMVDADPAGMRRWNAAREAALAEARRRYASGGDKRDGG